MPFLTSMTFFNQHDIFYQENMSHIMTNMLYT